MTDRQTDRKTDRQKDRQALSCLSEIDKAEQRAGHLTGYLNRHLLTGMHKSLKKFLPRESYILAGSTKGPIYSAKQATA